MDLYGSIFIILLLIFFYFADSVNKINREFVINHVIKLNKELKIIIKTIPNDKSSAIVKNVEFYKNQELLDSSITQYKEFYRSYYFIGEKGYYIYDKLF
ncbi:hypothetical protein [Bacillus sp. AFS088145]|uniref:hypothetical protein n=1 Tax=Bacillus sp. AFS088145 TaxID=2033514 RepID=UPI000BF62072|nr:hypothetical protein [Bacillus sp. AFS088145]PFH90719.1 hypothetical protein COI44_04330 [Bacillus sp. AFS088145]